MNILHTSDLHLGKRIIERDRLPEQEAVMEEIAAVCEREKVSLVLIAGDVFDTYMPSAEAEELFYRSLKKLAGEDRAVVVIAGNHDDGVRLAAAAPLAEEQGAYIFGNRPKRFKTGGDRPVRAVEAGENYLVIENREEERVYINALPYPNEARLKEDKTEEPYPEKVKRWIARGEAGYRPGLFHILLSHLFVAGGKISESERAIDLGGARAVPLSALPDRGYVALGHLHRSQNIGNARYSGSILQYSFDEANSQKSVTLIRTAGETLLGTEEIPLSAGKKLVRLECDGPTSALALLPRYENCWIELTLRLREPLTKEETSRLTAAAPGLVSLRPRLEAREFAPAASRSALTGGELFTEFCKSRFGEPPEEKLLSAFLELLETEG